MAAEDEHGGEKAVGGITHYTQDIDFPPTTWEEQATPVQIFEVAHDSPEFAMVRRAFYASLDRRRDGNISIVKLERVQNRPLWEEYVSVRRKVSEKNGGDPNEAEMWHGTRETPPEELYKDEECAFDMRYSAQGMWGRGAYFAKDSRYSLAYAHKMKDDGGGGGGGGGGDQRHKLMLALVTKGRVDDRGTEQERQRKKPSAGYHSVEAVTQGYRISVLYETRARAYPSYVLTYTKNAATASANAPAAATAYVGPNPFGRGTGLGAAATASTQAKTSAFGGGASSSPFGAKAASPPPLGVQHDARVRPAAGVRAGDKLAIWRGGAATSCDSGDWTAPFRADHGLQWGAWPGVRGHRSHAIVQACRGATDGGRATQDRRRVGAGNL